LYDDELLRFGVIAQEAEEALESVGYKNDTALVRVPENEEEEMWSVEYKEFIPHLINVVKSQQAEIDDLKARLDKLESIVNTK